MSNNARWLMLSFGVVALIVAYIAAKLIGAGLGLFDVEDPLAHVFPLTNIVGLAAGLATFLVLYKHKKANEFGNDVVKETRKVTWPTIPETRAATVVVIILTAIISLILGLFDYVFASLTSLIYS